ncbi:unnamed protein product [Parajaminaea phylloscopi]
MPEDDDGYMGDSGTMARLILLIPRHLISRNVLRPLALCFTWSCIVALLLYGESLSDWQQLASERTLAGLGSVTGLLLAFRSNSATSRWEGASKAWSTISATSRSLLRLLSTSLLQDAHILQTDQQGPKDNDGGDDEAESVAAVREHEEVVDLLRLVPCFALATMLQLQGETVDLSDAAQASHHSEALSAQTLIALLPPSYTASFQPPPPPVYANARYQRSRATMVPRMGSSRSSGTSSRRGSASSSTSLLDPLSFSEAERELKLSQNIDATKELLRRAKPQTDAAGRVAPQMIALDLLRALQAELNRFQQGIGGARPEVRLTGPIFAHCIGLLNTLSSQLTELERLRDTPMPAVVSSHLRFLLHVQVVLLPVALAAHVPPIWLPLPCMLLTAASFGLHALSELLALPFGQEREKLPVRRYVAEIVRDWRETAGRTEDVCQLLRSAEATGSRGNGRDSATKPSAVLEQGAGASSAWEERSTMTEQAAVRHRSRQRHRTGSESLRS